MGGAIARGLYASKSVAPEMIVCTTAGKASLADVASSMPGIETTNDNREAVKGADIVFLAVKPWIVENVMMEIGPHLEGNAIVCSVAAGISTSRLLDLLRESGAPLLPVFYIIPNIAASVAESITFYCSAGAGEEEKEIVTALLETIGTVMEVTEKQMPACCALASCGIALVMRYIRAAMEAGVEMGLYPRQAAEIVECTAKGAAALLLATGNHPEVEIDKVTTPGGITIRGLNTLEANGFTAAVIAAHKACL